MPRASWRRARVRDRVAPGISLGIALIGYVMTALLSGGCSSTPKSTDAVLDTPTSLRLRVDWSDAAAQRHARYEVDGRGSIDFGGGFDAASGRTTWSGELADADRDAIVALLERDGWLHAVIEGSGAPRSTRADVRIVWSGGDRRHRVRGESPQLDRLRAVLDVASRARFERFLRDLPQAGEQAR